MPENVERLALGVDRPPQRGQVCTDCGDLEQEVGAGLQGEVDQLLVAVVEHIQYRHQPAGGDVGEPGQCLVGTAAGHLGAAQHAVPEHIDRRRALVVNGDEAALRKEAVELVGLDPILPEGVQHHQHEGAEVVDLGQIDVLDRVPHSQRVEPELLCEIGDLVDVVGSGRDVDPHPAGARHGLRRLHGDRALSRLEVHGSQEHGNDVRIPARPIG